MDRRQFLWNFGGGLGGIALAQMLQGETHFPAKAKRVVQLFMSGAASQCDTFDYKPQLIRRNGEQFDPGGKVELFQSSPGAVMKSPWEWKPRGQCGKWISDLVPHIASCADEIAFVHSMQAKSNVHGPATFMQNTGFVLPGFPCMGSWVSYGLGSMNENLPAFIVLPDSRGYAPNGPGNWSAGFLPASHQGTMIRASSPNPIYDLFPPNQTPYITPASEADTWELLRQMNSDHLAQREGDSRLDARIASYEMAAKLQLSAPEVMDISGESDATRKLYGLDQKTTQDMGRNCLIARRLLERGVRFVQVGQPREPREGPRRDGCWHGPAHGSPDQGPEIPGIAGRHDCFLDYGVRPDAVQPGRQGKGPQSLRLHDLVGRRRDQGRDQLRRQRRVVVQGGGEAGLLLRRSCHGIAPSGDRPYQAHLSPQRNRSALDRRSRAGDSRIALIGVGPRAVTNAIY
jgi:Protein of unknown function (DUF1501)